MTRTSRIMRRIMEQCAARPQRSTATIQNTVRALIERGWLQRVKTGGRMYVMLTRDGAIALRDLRERDR
jgi:predicted transcriptional regulator